MSGSGPATVLLIEDDADVAEAVRDVLTDDGYVVEHAPNGREALAHLHSTGRLPAVILLDLRMPEMNGRQFREAQLADPTIADIPVVVLSAERSAVAQASELHAAAVIMKPVRPDQLVSVVERAKRLEN